MDEGRRAPRVQLECQIGFRRRGDARYRINLLDLSATGCCVTPPVPIESGERVCVRIADIEAIHGCVVWASEWRAGLHFDKSFHPAVLGSVVARLSTAPASAS